MKRTLLLSTLLFILAVQIGWGQIPQTISYQGVLTDSNGVVLSGTHDLTFNLYDVETGGDPVWGPEIHLSVEVNNGIFNVILGNPKNGTPVPLTSSFDKQYWLGVTVGTDDELPRIPLTSSPYSLNSSSLRLPFLGEGSVDLGSIFSITNRGNGTVAAFRGGNRSSGGMLFLSEGTGNAGKFVINNPENSSAALFAETNGTGNAGEFRGDVDVGGIITAEEMVAQSFTGSVGTFRTSSSSSTLLGLNEGTGNAGRFVINNLENSSPALFVQTTGTGNAGDFRGNVYVEGDAIITGEIKSNGKISATEIEVTDTVPIPDFVFEDDYNLMSLDELEKNIQKNKHLPDIPSAGEIAANGMNLGEMQAKLLQKIEELTLYMIELKKENEQLKCRIDSLEN